MLRRHVIMLATATLAVATLPAPAAAQQTFASRGQTIRAGIVILESARSNAVGSQPVSAGPHVWFNLDSNKSVKPAGWTFVNPHARTSSTEADQARWNTIESSIVPAPPAAYRVGLPPIRLSKRTAAYWEVRLGTLTENQISDYDVLLINPAHRAQLNPAEREKLRRFVDKGGVLWIDPAGLPVGGIDNGNSFPVPFRTVPASTAVEFKDFSQPLLSGPQPLSMRDLAALSTTPDSTSFDRDLMAPDVSEVGDIGLLFGESYTDFGRLKPVVGISDDQFSLGVARIGDGFVVVTGRAISLKLNRVRVAENPQNFGYTTNLSFFARDANLQADGIAAAKLAINMISLGREYGQPQGGSQRSGSSAIDLTAPLIKRAADTLIAGTDTAPVLYKGLLVTTAGNFIRVYDADPARDFDGDGKTDDGAPDTGVEGRDLIWESTDLGADLSSPVCTEVPSTSLLRGPNSPITDQVLVTDSLGRLHALDLIRYNPDGTVNGQTRGDITGVYPVDAPAGSGSIDVAGKPNPPTVHENIAYMADRVATNQGRVWMVDLINGVRPRTNRDWGMGGSGIALPPFSAGATVGYIPILDNSGGMDRVLYAPSAPVNAAPAPSQPAGFVSLWLGAKGERPTDFEPKSGTTAAALTVTTRAAREGLPIFLPGIAHPYGVRLTLVREDGSVYSAAQMAGIFSGAPTQTAGLLTFPFRSPVNQLPADVTGIRVDYSIDYGFGSGPEIANAKRGDIMLPDATTPVREIKGSLALSQKGTLYMTHTGGGRSALYGFREEGRGSFRCVMRYELYGEHTMGGQGVPDQTIPPIFTDVDLTQNFAPAFLRQPFTTFAFNAPPVVRGDVVFAAAQGMKGVAVPTTVLMAFKAEPEVTSIYLDGFSTTGSIVQPDLARSVVRRRPEIMPSFQLGQFPGMTYDEETKLLRIENLATATKGQLQSVVNLSQPILVRVPGGGTSDRFLYPNGNNAANRFDPLLWFTVLNGYTPTSNLAVTGNTLFIGGASPLRNILTNGTLVPEGLLYALETDISPSSAWLASSPGRPWMKQLLQLRNVGAGFEGNPAQKWPQIGGVSDFNDYLIRLNQTVVPGNEVKFIAAGEGVLAAVGSTGLYTYSRSDFVVADQGRIASFDPSGNPTFEMTATGSAGDVEVVNAGESRPIVRPSRAYPLPNNEFLVVDPGANRVFRVNRAGTETRAISRFRLDPGKTPPNYPANGPLTLNGPRDAVMYTTIEPAGSVSQFFSPSAAAYEYWTHYLIADSGNRRLVEVVDRYEYDPVNRRIGGPILNGTTPQLGVLLWHSPTAVGGKGYEYNSLSRVWVNDRYVYFAGIGGALPTLTDTGGRPPAQGGQRETAGYGGVAVFDPNAPNGVAVFNTVAIPAIGQNVFWNDATNSFSSPERPARNQQLVNVSSVTARQITDRNGALQVAVMITDASGVYEVFYNPPVGGAELVPAVTWMLPNEVYRAMRRDGGGIVRTSPRDLRATYARRLESGEVLVVNGYFGQTRGTRNADGTFSNREPFRGEVVQVSGTNLDMRTNEPNMGFGLRSITFNLELVKDARGLVLPVFADRR
ncbi:MAG: hypothetical protein ACO1SV_26000 [Fimbriimonas sp.]